MTTPWPNPLIALSCLALFAAHADAEPLQWGVPTGPESSDVLSIIVDPHEPTRLYAGVRGTLFSDDSGATWRESGLGLDQESVWSLEADPAIPGTIYAGTGNRGVFKTMDGGVTWVPTGEAVSDWFVWDVEVDPANSAIVFAGTQGSGLFRSADGGMTWTPSGAGIPETPMRDIAFDPENSQIVYVATRFQGVYKSIDGGATWNRGNPDDASSSGLSFQTRKIAIDGSDPSTLYAGTVSGVYKTIDGGDNWNPANVGIEFESVSALVVNPDDSQEVYAGTLSGMFKSSDGGANWARIETGIPDTVPQIRSLAIDPSAPGTLYIAENAAGVFKTTDAGASWAERNAGIIAASVFDLSIHPGNPERVLAATGGGVFGTNNGIEWIRKDGNLTGGTGRAIAHDPNSPDMVLLAVENRGVFRSTDGGETWARSDSGIPTQFSSALVMDPVTSGRAFVGTGVGLFVTADRGDSWTSASSDLEGKNVIELAISEADPNRMLAGVRQDGVFLSTDRGASWASVVGTEGGLPLALALDPFDSQRAFIGTWENGVQRTIDGGMTWVSAASGLPEDAVVDIVFAGRINEIYAATYGGGVYRSVDGGDRWVRYGDDAGNNFANTIAASPPVFYAGTDGSSVVRLIVPEIVFRNGFETTAD